MCLDRESAWTSQASQQQLPLVAFDEGPQQPPDWSCGAVAAAIGGATSCGSARRRRLERIQRASVRRGTTQYSQVWITGRIAKPSSIEELFALRAEHHERGGAMISRRAPAIAVSPHGMFEN